MPVWPDPDRPDVKDFIRRLRTLNTAQWLTVIERYAGGTFTAEAEEAAARIIRGVDLHISDREKDARVAAAEPAYDRVAEALADLAENAPPPDADIPYRQMAFAASCAAVKALMASPDLKPHIARVLTDPFDFAESSVTTDRVKK
jgi:hypothetical protein